MKEKPFWFKSRVDSSPEADLRRRVKELLKYQ
jgi:hypothetical protein